MSSSLYSLAQRISESHEDEESRSSDGEEVPIPAVWRHVASMKIASVHINEPPSHEESQDCRLFLAAGPCSRRVKQRKSPTGFHLVDFGEHASILPTYQAYLEPHHHCVSVQAGRANRNACPALAASLGKALDRWRDVASERLTVQRLDREMLWKGRTGDKAFVAADTGRQLLRYLRTRSMHRFTNLSPPTT